MFGNCSHTNSIEGANNIQHIEHIRHSVHSGQQWHQSAAQSLDTGLPTTYSCSFMQTVTTSSSYSLRSKSPSCNGQLPPALPPKMRKAPLSPPSSPSPPAVTSTPVRCENTPPAENGPTEDSPPDKTPPREDSPNQEPELMEMTDVDEFLVFKKPEEDGPEIRGGYVDALIVQATKSSKKGELNFFYFLCLLCCVFHLNVVLVAFFPFMSQQWFQFLYFHNYKIQYKYLDFEVY